MSCFAKTAVMPNAGALAATARPIRPRPMMPSCLPRSSMPSMKSSAQPFQSPRADEAIALGDPPRRGEDQPPRQLGRRLGQDVGRVRHHDPARSRRRHVDVVVPDRDVRHDRELRRGVEHVAVDAVGQHADERPLVGEPPLQLVGGQRRRPVVQVDVAGSLEAGEHGSGDACAMRRIWSWPCMSLLTMNVTSSDRAIRSTRSDCTPRPAR